MFGAQHGNTAGGGTGLFGAQQPGAAQTTSLFGGQQTAASTNSLFGGQQTAAPTNSLFGGQQKTAQTTGLFGGQQTTAPTTSLFGGQQTTAPASTGLFGGQQNTAVGAGGNTGGGLFGTQQPAGTASNTGLFGAQQPSTLSTGTGLFGAQQPAATATTGLFGTQKPATAAPTTGLFGTQQSKPAGTSLFGTQQPATTAQTTGLFGAQQPSTLTTGSSLFGTQQPAATTGLFGTQPSGAIGGGLFGAQQATNTATGTGLFKLQTTQPATQTIGNSLFATQPVNTNFYPAVAQVTAGQEEMIALEQQIMAIRECWDPASPYCQFRHYFYNSVEPFETSRYQCPPGDNLAMWTLAQENNPDRKSLIPVVVVGYEGLRARVDLQLGLINGIEKLLEQLQGKVKTLAQKRHDSTLLRILDFQRKQSEINQKLIRLMKNVQLLRLRNQVLRPEEEVFRIRVNDMCEKLSKDLKARLADVIANEKKVRAEFESRAQFISIQNPSLETHDTSELFEVLDKNTRGISYLSETIMRLFSEIQSL